MAAHGVGWGRLLRTLQVIGGGMVSRQRSHQNLTWGNTQMLPIVECALEIRHVSDVTLEY